jgi:Cd2+/Zn2+-exporting ATPase
LQDSGTTNQGNSLRLKVKDLDCADCARTLEHVARRIEGVADARVSVALSQIELTLQPGVERKAVTRTLRRKGYDVMPLEGEVAARKPSLKGVISLQRLILTSACGILVLAALLAWLAHAPAGAVRVLLIAAAAAGLPLSLLRAANAIRTLSIDMNVLMTVAIVAAATIGDWEEAAVIAFLFSIANILEALAMARTRKAIESLVDLSPDRATVKRGSEQTVVDADAVKPGEVIIVKPGERIPLEGKVIAGVTSVDEAPITGESMPVTKQPGSQVFAGTLNEEGLVEIEVTKPKEESTLARIIHLVEHIAETKAPIERFVDRFAAIYTPAVVIGAVLLAVIPRLAGLEDGWTYRAIVLLIIACPCALVIATPVAIVSGLTSAARKGILIKGGVHLEEAARISAVALDKTGTLTAGRPVVAAVRPRPGISEVDFLRLAAGVESASTHPLAGAVLAEARRRAIHWPEPTDVESITGSGMTASLEGIRYYAAKPEFFAERFAREGVAHAEDRGRTIITVGTESATLGEIEFTDEIRQGSRETLSALRRLGIKQIVMVTGDRAEVAREVAEAIGVDQYHANLLPQAKVDLVERLKSDRRHVAMVGDGVNDAPALAASDLGIAMGAAGSDTAIETADVALMGDDIRNLVPLFAVSRRAKRITQENIVFALAVKAIFLSLAATGNATMWMAVFADMGASLIVIANALRLLSDKAMGLRA